jgi:hypothetical protein
MDVSANDDTGASLRLDGNAAAGLLAELFAFDATRAEATCDGCAQASAIGALMLYGEPMGAVFRCPGCGHCLICATRVRGVLCFELRGVRLLRAAIASEAAGS